MKMIVQPKDVYIHNFILMEKCLSLQDASVMYYNLTHPCLKQVPLTSIFQIYCICIFFSKLIEAPCEKTSLYG